MAFIYFQTWRRICYVSISEKTCRGFLHRVAAQVDCAVVVVKACKRIAELAPFAKQMRACLRLCLVGTVWQE
jgi:hypothetical protein